MRARIVIVVALVLVYWTCTSPGASASPAPHDLGPGVVQSTSSVSAYPGVPSTCCFNTVLPPGNNGFVPGTALIGKEALSSNPPHSADQIGMYQNLIWGYPTLTDANLGQFYKNEDLGVPDDVTSQSSPEPGVTIAYDGYGVPHITGDTREETMFGAGYALAQTRLFEADALRHVGRADVAGFAGGANATQDALQWAIAPYTEQDLDDQVAALRDNPAYHQIYQDGVDYIAGINAYIAQAQQNPLQLLPGEYFALGMPGGPQPFVPADLVAIASAIAGAEGVGGGTELSWTLLMQDLEAKLGARAGLRAFLDFHSLDDPAAPTTVRGVDYPYLTVPAHPNPRTEGIPDPGSVSSPTEVAVSGGAGAARRGAHRRAAVRHVSALTVMSEGERYGAMLPTGESNALLISARDSASGHPLGLMGPQLGYFSPAILMEESLVGPGIDVEGAAVPGVSQYVVMGHGEDYAWSATSGYEGVISTFAVPLCNPAGGAVSPGSLDYEYKGQCLAMRVLTRTESWTPNLADSTPAGSQTLTAYVTNFGIVEARGTVHGRPVAFTEDRSTYGHELDSALGFQMFDDPDTMRGPVDFEQAASKIGYAFNWLYLDSAHIAYVNAGLLPVRAPGTDPVFPTMSTSPWVGFDGTTNTSADLSAAAHPHVIDQPWITSWNNHEAPGYSLADDLTNYSSVWRSQLLDAGIRTDLKHGQKMTLAELVQVMERAGLVDLRAWAVGPELLQILGTGSSDPQVQAAIAALHAWIQAGSLRETTGTASGGPTNSSSYENAQAIQIMDAWWPLLVKAIYASKIGPAAFAALETVDPTDQPPDNQALSPGGGGEYHMGSAWDVGFYGTVQTDLADVLGRHPRGALSLRYCGNGVLSACRAQLLSSLQQALAEPADQVYPGYGGTPSCPAGNQVCNDAIRFSALGALTQPFMSWINRPTFQQADEIFAHRPFPALPACALAEYPTVRILTVHLRRGRLTVTGRATPRDCDSAPARLRRVQVRIGRGAWHTARGTAHWRLSAAVGAHRPRLQARVIDASGTVATSPARAG